MLIRVLSLLLPMAAGGVIGGLLGHWPGALAGVVLVATALGVIEFLRLHRLQEWLRRLQMAHLEERPDAVIDFEPPSGRIWGETVDRVRRLLKMHIRAQQDSERRLQEMLSAIQASPNGVVLLDAEGRIEWCRRPPNTWAWMRPGTCSSMRLI